MDVGGWNEMVENEKRRGRGRNTDQVSPSRTKRANSKAQNRIARDLFLPDSDYPR